MIVCPLWWCFILPLSLLTTIAPAPSLASRHRRGQRQCTFIQQQQLRKATSGTNEGAPRWTRSPPPLYACPLGSTDANGEGGPDVGAEPAAERPPPPQAGFRADRGVDVIRGTPAPGPLGLPYVGNMLEMAWRGGVDRWDAHVYRRYGPVARSHLLGTSGSWLLVDGGVCQTGEGTAFGTRSEFERARAPRRYQGKGTGMQCAAGWDVLNDSERTGWCCWRFARASHGLLPGGASPPVPLCTRVESLTRGGGAHFRRRRQQRCGGIYRLGSCSHPETTHPPVTGSTWYTVSTPELAREVLVTRERDFSTRFIPPVVRVWMKGAEEEGRGRVCVCCAHV
jgi:hypothetical protein